MKKFLFIFIPLGLVTLVAAVLLLPELWFRAPIVHSAIEYIGPKVGVVVRTEELGARAYRTGWKSFRFEISALALNVKSEGSFELHAERVDTSVEVLLFALPPQLLRVDRLKLSDATLVFEPGPEIEPKTKSEGFVVPDLRLAGWVPSLFRETVIGDVDVQFALIRFDPEFSLKAKLWSETDRLRLSAEDLGKSIDRRFSAMLPLTGQRALNPSALEAGFHWKAKEIGSLHGDVRSTPCEKITQACFRGSAAWTAPASNKTKTPQKVEGEFSLLITEQDVKLDLRASANDIVTGLKKVTTLSPCQVTARFETGEDIRSTVSCELHAQLNIPPIRGVPKLRMPTESHAKIQLEARFADAKEGLPYEGNLRVDAAPAVAPLLDATIKLRSEFNGLLSQGIDGLHQRSELNLEARTPEIGRVVDILHRTQWAIPAPLNNLRGPIEILVSSRWKDWDSKAPFTLSTRLDSKEQALKTSAEGVVELQVRPEFTLALNAKWLLEQVRLSLPRFDPMSIPRFFPAAEIRRKKPKKKEASVFTYDVQVETPPSGQIRIDSTLVKAPIDFKFFGHFVSNEPPDLRIEASPVPFEVFRKQGRIKSFRYVSAKPGKRDEVDGVVELKSGAYTVRAHAYGSTAKTHVDLSSDPPAREEDLWAILLFGEPLDALDEDQSESAQATSQAVAQGAFGLFSLYAFASTPVERVGYDPTTQRVSVSFRVQEGTSIELGRSEESSAEVGLKRRLGHGWQLKLQASKASEDEASPSSSKGRVGAGIEWSNRY